MLPKVLIAFTVLQGVMARGMPTIAIPLLSQLSMPAPLATLDGVFPTFLDTTAIPVLRVPPAWSFSIGWLTGTFSSSHSDELFYWAMQVNGVPLPLWLQFDNTTLTFFGTTPNISHAITKNILITLYSGAALGDNTSAASANFTLQVSDNNLFLSKGLPVIEAIASNNLSVDLREPLLSALGCIRGSIRDFHIRAEIDTSGEDWLHWDRRAAYRSLVLSGKVRDNDLKGRNISLPVAITVQTGPDTMQSSLVINILPYPFLTLTFPNITVSRGSAFHVSIANGIPTDNPFFDTYSIVAPSYDWLNIDYGSLQIQGVAPLQGFLTSEIAINISASGSSNITVSSIFFLTVKATSPEASPVSKSNSHKSLVTFIVTIPVLVCGCVAAIYWGSARARSRLQTKVIRAELMRPVDIGVCAPSQNRLPALCSAESGEVHVAREKYPCISPLRDQSPAAPFPIHAVEATCESKVDVYPSLVLQRTFNTPRQAESEPNLDDVSSIAQMPSMNFTMLLSPHPEVAASRDWRGKQAGGPNVDQDSSRQNAWDMVQQIQQARSVNSAYDSLPSWDSESTWHYERRRRPPSPAWQRDDVDRGTTLYDVLHEQAYMLHR